MKFGSKSIGIGGGAFGIKNGRLKSMLRAKLSRILA